MKDPIADRQFVPLRKVHCRPDKREIDLTVKEALHRLSQMGHRRTPLSKAVLTAMAKKHSPICIKELSSLAGICDSDPSSIFRLVKRLESAGIVECINVAHTAPRYLLVMSGHHHSYLVCRSCGQLEEVAQSESLSVQETNIQLMPWDRIRPEIWFSGICPACI